MIQGAMLGIVGLGMAILAMFLPRPRIDSFLPQ
jgi:hypothetical protein